MAKGTSHTVKSPAQYLNWGIEALISVQQLVGEHLVFIVLLGVYLSPSPPSLI